MVIYTVRERSRKIMEMILKGHVVYLQFDRAESREPEGSELN